MSNQLQITGGAKVRNLEGVITGTSGVLSSVPLGAANGVATLDSGGKVPVSQLPSSVVTYLGTWNAATNTPTLVNGTGDAGDLYLCNVAGTVNFGAGPITFAIGDWVLYGSGTWQKSNGQNGTVTSVAASITGNSLGITGSPITTAGTLAFSFAGTNLQYINGAGDLTTFPSLTGYIPYTGATSSIDLNNQSVVNISHLGINTATVPTILLRAVGDNNSSSRIAMRGYSSNANSSSIRVTKFRGTAGAPQAPLSGDSLGKFELAGYGTTSSEGYPQASFEGIATENWGATARGSKTVIKITPNTTITQAIALTINQDKSAVFENSVTGTSLIKTGGTSSQFLKADGSVDSSAYITLGSLSATSPIFYNNTTGVISSQAASATLSGYVTTGTQTIAGAKTFTSLLNVNNKIYLQTDLGSTGVYFQSYSSNELSIGATSGATVYYSSFILQYATRSYTLPNADGTIALVESTQTFTGTNTFTQNLKLDGNGSNAGTLLLKNNTTFPVAIGYASINSNGNNINLTAFVSATKTASLDLSGISDNIPRTYTFPNASGTIALVGGSGVGTVTSVAALTLGTSGTDLSSTVANSTTTPVITLNVPTASATNRGALSSADWTTFNNKQNALTNPVTGTGVNGRLAYWSGTNTITNSGNLTWDNTYSALSSPVFYALNASGAAFNLSSNTDNVGKIQNVTSTSWSLAYGTGNLAFPLGTSVLTWDTTNKVTFAGTLSNGTYTYTLPSATGTLALTSSLSSYLPLTGGTLTGGLYINPTNTATVGLDVASDTIRFRSDNLEGYKRQLEITMGSGTLVQCVAKGFGGTYGTDLAFYTSSASGVNGNPAMYITGGNQIGIGTGLPSYTLDVSGTLRNTTSAYFATSSGSLLIGTTTSNGFKFKISNNGAEEVAINPGDSANVNNYVNYNRSTASYIQANYLASTHAFLNGNVGIGTSSPASLLSVGPDYGSGSGFATPTAIQMDNSYKSGTPAFDKLKFYLFKSSTESYGFNVADNSDLQYWAGTTSTGVHRWFTSQTERMRITSGGNVGINSTGNSNCAITIKGFTTGSVDNALYVTNSANSQLMALRNDGLFGAGTLALSPYNFDPGGHIMYVNSSGQIGSLSSTRESKTNINTISNIDYIYKLNPVSFNMRKRDETTYEYTDEYNEEIRYGFIADEVEKLNEDLVVYNNNDGNKKLSSVNYISFIPVLVKAVQELSKQNQEQNQTIQELSNRLIKLESK
jgi:hypothetical protein